VPYVRTVKTASGAMAVQIVYSSHRGSREIEHIGPAHDDVELELLKAVARQRLAPGRASWTWAWMRLRRAGRCRSPARTPSPPPGPLSDDLRQAIKAINTSQPAHHN
jgi:hypothetical protein